MQEPRVQLIGTPDIKISEFLRVANQALGYNVTKPVDSAKTKPHRDQEFLSALLCLYDESRVDRPLHEVMSEAISLSNHLNYTFMIAANRDTLFRSMERTSLHHTISDNDDMALAIITGSLREWRLAMVECTSDHSHKYLRMMYDRVMLSFEKHGLSLDLRKRGHKDGTFLIENKP